MIDGVKIIGHFGKNNKITEFTYKHFHGGRLTEEFNAMTKEDFELLDKQAIEDGIKDLELEKRIAEKRAAMTPEERVRQDEADRAVFERWQDEANTNAILDGIKIEGEDLDFNPFRKDND